MFSNDAFERLTAEIFSRVSELRTKKGGEYAGDHDCLANFRRNGERLNLPMEVIWAIYASKHWDAIMQYCADVNKGVNRPRMETLDGRCDDLIVYLMLFEAMLMERRQVEATARV